MFLEREKGRVTVNSEKFSTFVVVVAFKAPSAGGRKSLRSEEFAPVYVNCCNCKFSSQKKKYIFLMNRALFSNAVSFLIFVGSPRLIRQTNYNL